jgi:HSP20 family protein
MSIRDLIPWKSKNQVPVTRNDEMALTSLHDEIDRLFGSFFEDFSLAPWEPFAARSRTFSPSINVSETDKKVTVTAELPGIDEKDIDVTLANGMVTIKGEKKEEHEDNKSGYHRIERSYGTFRRSVSLPAEVDDSKASAEFSKGVLTLTVPKTETAQKLGRKIAVKKG